MRFGFFNARIIYPPTSTNDTEKFIHNDDDNSITKSNSGASNSTNHTRPTLPQRTKSALKFIAKTRVRITHNTSTPLLAILIFPIICILLSIGFFIHLAGGKSAKEFIVGPTPIRKINDSIDKPFVIGCQEPDLSNPKANAAFVVLARNKEIKGVRDSMKSLERHFNRWYQYPYVFLNDEPFNQTFMDTVRSFTNATVEFGQIPEQDWEFPNWTDQDEVKEAIAKQGDATILYGGMESYHKMCRFYSGKFYNHPLLLKYDWYWRVEPDVKFFCDITYDPFVEMEKAGKVYGFTVVIRERLSTIPNLFRHSVAFKQKYGLNETGTWDMFLSHPTDEVYFNEYKKKQKEKKKNKKKGSDDNPTTMTEDSQGANNHSSFVSEWDDWELDGKAHPYAMNGQVYSLCHFWSNFEIARLDFFRSKQYNDYFEYLDSRGGFWNERWGDAPVHSLAAGLFLEPEQIHYFSDIGYRHQRFQNCPANAKGKQYAHKEFFFTGDPNNKKDQKDDAYWRDIDEERENGVGCRCRCDPRVEGGEGVCLNKWVNIIGGYDD